MSLELGIGNSLQGRSGEDVKGSPLITNSCHNCEITSQRESRYRHHCQFTRGFCTAR